MSMAPEMWTDAAGDTSYSPVWRRVPDSAIRRATEAVEVDAESEDRIESRVLEARGADAEGGRIFAVQVVEAGVSRNKRRYPMRVLAAAAPLYEGAKAFDHHRTEAELRTSSIDGLVGQYHNVRTNERGIEAELHLLPSASKVAEALDASLAAQGQGLAPLIGISHDVQIRSRFAQEAIGRVEEVTEIGRVRSVDVIADPSAGGKALRAVAGGTGAEEGTNDMDLKQLLALLRDADSAKRAELLKEHADLVKGWEMDDATVTRLADAMKTPEPEKPADPAPAAAAPVAPVEGAPVVPEPVAAGVATEAAYDRDGLIGTMLISRALEAVGLDAKLTDEMRKQLPERITEADVTKVMATGQTFVRALEAAGLEPKVGHAVVGEEDFDKKSEKLYQSICRNWDAGYSRISEAYLDITGERHNMFGMDLAHQIVRESWDIDRIPGTRATESVSSGTWSKALGNSLHRRLIELYIGSAYSNWRQIVRTKPINDFRTQELIVMGGYGALGTVAEGAPYQPVSSPTDAENTYVPTKKGGTEDFTFETALNDDIGALARIPEGLARAAALTIANFVWLTLFVNNPNVVDLDGTDTLFSAGRSNTTAVALSHAGVNSLRQKMRSQTMPGVSTDPLGLLPQFLIVPNNLEELAFEICTSPFGIPATTPGATNVPNLHQGLIPLVVDLFTDTNDWFLAADPTQSDTIEIGFLGGREDPELLMQDDPRVGAVFSADKVTWKIRHIYGGSVANFRAFQRGTQ